MMNDISRLDARRGLEVPELEPVKIRDYRGWLIGIVLALMLINMGFVIYGAYLAAQAPSTEVSDLRVTGPTDLCPGEPFEYEYTVTFSHAGEFAVWIATQSILQGPADSTIIRTLYVEVQEFRADEPGKIVMVHRTPLPERYIDQRTGRATEWQPGEHMQTVVARVAGRVSGSNALSAYFTIRDDCEGE